MCVWMGVSPTTRDSGLCPFLFRGPSPFLPPGPAGNLFLPRVPHFAQAAGVDRRRRSGDCGGNPSFLAGMLSHCHAGQTVALPSWEHTVDRWKGVEGMGNPSSSHFILPRAFRNGIVSI